VDRFDHANLKRCFLRSWEPARRRFVHDSQAHARHGSVVPVDLPIAWRRSRHRGAQAGLRKCPRVIVFDVNETLAGVRVPPRPPRLRLESTLLFFPIGPTPRSHSGNFSPHPWVKSPSLGTAPLVRQIQASDPPSDKCFAINLLQQPNSLAGGLALQLRNLSQRKKTWNCTRFKRRAKQAEFT